MKKFWSNFFLNHQRSKLFYILLAVFLLVCAGAIIFIDKYPERDIDQQGQNLTQNSSETTSENDSNTQTSGDNEQTANSAPAVSNRSSVNSNISATSTGGASNIESSAADSSSSNPPTPESPSAIVVFYADTQSDSDSDDANHQRVVNYILSTSASTVFHAGDLMEDGTQDSLDRFNNVTATLRAAKAFYSAIGNNERNSSLYFNNFTYPNNERWFSVNVGNLHMVILDSVYSASDPNQASWLEADLAGAASQSRITGVMYHYPTYSSAISSTLTNNGVEFSVAGHIHSYSRSSSGGVVYFTLSGQTAIGYMVAKIYADSVVFYAYDSNNNLIDSATIAER